MIRVGLSTVQKCIVALYMLVYGIPAHACDKDLKLRETTTLEAMKSLIVAIHTCFSDTYLWWPTYVNLKK